MRRKKKGYLPLILFGAVVIVAVGLIIGAVTKGRKANISNAVADTINRFIADNNLSVSDYPPELLELLDRNAETEDFVLNYPFYKNKSFKIDLSEYKNSASVPLLMQWDKRWGYKQYGDNIMGLTGCGPVCLSMVAIYLTGNTSLSPAYIADFSISQGYCVPGSGSSWKLMSRGAERLGLNAEELPLDKGTVIGCLDAGSPVICIMGAGDFTSTGHYIVLKGVSDGKLLINDPNSRKNSEKSWDFDSIKGQIRNLWAYTA